MQMRVGSAAKANMHGWQRLLSIMAALGKKAARRSTWRRSRRHVANRKVAVAIVKVRCMQQMYIMLAAGKAAARRVKVGIERTDRKGPGTGGMRRKAN